MEKLFSKSLKYPSPEKSFNFALKTIEEIKDSALIVLDTNVLLLPFTTDIKSTKAIKRVYSQLSEEKRIFLPSHAVREYLDNRASKITNLHASLKRAHQETFNLFKHHPLLAETTEYNEIEKAEKELNNSIKQYKEAIKKSIDLVQGWGWNDPISKIYHETLGDRILEDTINEGEIRENLEHRNIHKLPPGYKDDSKDSNREGDLIIWHEILNLAESEQKDVIFVSNDGKQDWFHQSDKQGLYPRFELVDEFREITNGLSFHIITMSKLLELYGSEKAIIESVKSTEIYNKENLNSDLHDDLIKNKATTHNEYYKKHKNLYSSISTISPFLNLANLLPDKIGKEKNTLELAEERTNNFLEKKGMSTFNKKVNDIDIEGSRIKISFNVGTEVSGNEINFRVIYSCDLQNYQNYEISFK